jgi:predicted amidophosphoribosyltransferase
VRIWAAGSYDPVPRRLLTAFKERRRRSLGTMLGRRLGAAVAALVVDTRAAGPLVLAPVPSRRAAARSRPYDAVGILAEVAAESLVAAGVPTRTVHVLHHRRDVADQAGLSRSSRERNLAGALAGTRVDGALVVVVDDIVTTGATVAESVRALCAVGCAVLGAAAVAATVKRT